MLLTRNALSVAKGKSVHTRRAQRAGLVLRATTRHPSARSLALPARPAPTARRQAPQSSAAASRVMPSPLPMAEGKAASRLVSVIESTIASHRATPTASRRSHAKPVREARCAGMARSVRSETPASIAQTRAASRAAGACKAAGTMSSCRVTLATRCAPR